MKRCLLVIGMHRSGTSALARVLNLLGARMDYSLEAASFDNPKGFWEPSEVVAIHERLFADLGFRHDTYLGLADDWLQTEAAAVARSALADFVARAAAGDAIIVIKDPRICRLIPLWREVLEQANIEVDVVLPIRNPVEVAQSLHARNGYHLNKGLLMWLRHTLAAERDSRACRRAIVTYDRLLADWRGVAAQIGGDLGMLWPQGSDQVAHEIDAFLDTGLRHHLIATDVSTDLAWVTDTWEAMLSLVSQPQRQLPILDRVYIELGRAEVAFAPLGDPDEQVHSLEITELQAVIRSREEDLAQARRMEQAMLAQAAIAQQQQDSEVWQARTAELMEEVSALRAALQAGQDEIEARTAALRDIAEQSEALRAQRDHARTRLAGLAGLTTARPQSSPGPTRMLMRWHGDRDPYADETVNRAAARERMRQARRLAQEIEAITTSGFFDTDFYLRRNPDVAAARIDPIRHYCVDGWREGRNPSASFDTLFYLGSHPDVLAEAINPFWHSLRFAWAEGRSASSPDPSLASD